MFEAIVDNFISAATVENMQQLIQCARAQTITDDDIAYFAKRLADSGEIIHPPLGIKAADIASTGGPSSLTTIICPLYLAALGYMIPKLAVPGRPAGGVDIMAQIPGYRYKLHGSEVSRVLAECGYAHFLATEAHAPRDGQLFDYRKKVDAVNIPELVIASLLSKKIAVGLAIAGLDVRVAFHGSFGSTWEMAKSNAEKFNRVAALLNVVSVCFLTDGQIPYQPFIGRGEALLALDELFNGVENKWLKKHVDMCHAMVKSITGVVSDAPSGETLLAIFSNHLKAQGTKLEAYYETVRKIKDAPRYEITADASGVLVVDLKQLRETLVAIQIAGGDSATQFVDPAGLILEKNTRDYIRRGDTLATVRCISKGRDEVLKKIGRSLKVTDSPGEIGGFEEIRHA